MTCVERVFVLGSLIYMSVYIPFVITACLICAPAPPPLAIVPLHFLGMGLNLIAIVLTMRDLYLREMASQNAKLTWGLLITCTGGIGWLVYVFKYALKPRS